MRSSSRIWNNLINSIRKHDMVVSFSCQLGSNVYMKPNAVKTYSSDKKVVPYLSINNCVWVICLALISICMYDWDALFYTRSRISGQYVTTVRVCINRGLFNFTPLQPRVTELLDLHKYYIQADWKLMRAKV